MELYLNNSSIENNKYFKTHKDLLNISKTELEDIKAYKKWTGFLKNSNSNLGKQIYAFDLPAVVSCPDSSTCFKTCYANKGTFIFGALSLHKFLMSSLSLGDNLSLNSK